MLREFSDGARYLLRGVHACKRMPRTAALGIIPALLTGVLLAAGLIALWWNLPDLLGWGLGFSDAWSSPWREILFLLIGAAVVGVSLSVAASLFTAITLFIGGPFYDVISERVEKHEGEESEPADFPWYTSLGESLRVALIALPIGVAFLLLGCIPLVGQLGAGVGGFTFAAWVMTLELSATALQRRGMRLRERRALLRQHRARTLGFGAAVIAVCLIPLGAVLVMPAAVAGATLFARDVVAGAKSAQGAQ